MSRGQEILSVCSLVLCLFKTKFTDLSMNGTSRVNNTDKYHFNVVSVRVCIAEIKVNTCYNFPQVQIIYYSMDAMVQHGVSG